MRVMSLLAACALAHCSAPPAGADVATPGDTNQLDAGGPDAPRDAAGLDAPGPADAATADAPRALDAPAGLDVPAGLDAPRGTDVPLGTDAPLATDAPRGTDVPLGTDVPVTALAVGAAAIAQRTYALGPATGTLTTAPVGTQPAGSTLLVSLARGTWSAAPDPPSDSRANSFTLLGGTHPYGAWPTSRTGLFHAVGARGGAGHTFAMTWGPAGGAGDEVTLTAVEVLGATTVHDSAWVERDPASAITSGTVQTTGPAVLVAWWWGSGGVRPVGTSHVAVPGDGFTLLPAATGLRSLSLNGYVQVAVAYRVVAAPGTYSVTWTTDGEGAQLYLVALQGP